MCNEFEQLLDDQAPLQSYTEWLDRMVDRCVVQVYHPHPNPSKKNPQNNTMLYNNLNKEQCYFALDKLAKSEQRGYI